MLDAQYLENLDGLSTEWRDYLRHAETLESLPVSGEDRNTARLLARYARYKADSMLLRQQGNIPYALEIEGHMERVYSQLPSYARW